MARSYYSLKKFSALFGVEVDELVQAWLDDKLHLYVNFGNEIFPCILRRCVSPNIHKNTIHDINYGRDFYQSKDSPAYSILSFIPEIPLNPHLDIQKRFDTGGIDVPVSGEYYEYRYRGYAYGYWIARPTKVARFSSGKYLLTDKDSVEQKKSPPGDVMVFSHNSFDFLIFPESTYIDESFLSIREDHASLFLNGLNIEKTKVNNINVSFLVPEEYVALYILMHECCRRTYGKLDVSSVFKPLNKLYSGDFSFDTLKRYAKKPELNRTKAYRVSKKQKRALCYLITDFCKKYEIEQTVSSVVNKLTAVTQLEPHSINFSFSESKVKEWMDISKGK
ncbi:MULTISPECIES: hypothetical protein [Enterobacteriaceae]|uniref:hypothetical protein n=1 Tax=Enterobacteriaceae TaxID=543 RepID=UPI0013992EE3|nr:hypothetical protein [Citrobacter freundii]MDT7057300.1 hypothetical protein [Citrobacter freundii]MDT7387437.1 hypothetical protein [Citrobacter freundii]QHX04961.1 hypothetical protein GZS04_23300 [Citrobacter freundii]